MELEIVRIVQDTSDTKTFFLVNVAENKRAFDYYAGQYLTFRFDNLAPKPVVRSYTMSSSPIEEDFAAVTVKEISGGLISNYFCKQVKVGDILRARGPMGRFIYDREKALSELVMIAAGSGVTPFISILREYSRLPIEVGPQKMTLIVGFRTEEDIIGRHEFAALENNPRVQIVITLSREHCKKYHYGRLDPHLVDEVLSCDYKNKTFMTCGPEEMMAMIGTHLLGRGVEKEHSHMESFA